MKSGAVLKYGCETVSFIRRPFLHPGSFEKSMVGALERSVQAGASQYDAAVHPQYRSGDEPRLVGGQIDACGGYLFGFAEPS